MTPDRSVTADLQAALDAAGIVVTAEGRARARRKLDEAASQHSDGERAEQRRLFLARLDRHACGAA